MKSHSLFEVHSHFFLNLTSDRAKRSALCPLGHILEEIGICGWVGSRAKLGLLIIRSIFFLPMPPHVLVDFAVFPPRHDRSVTDF